MFVDDDETPVLRLPTSSGLTLEFERDWPYGPDEPYAEGMLVRVFGNHVRLEQQVILMGSVDLSTFLRNLYDDFRGWPGERTWCSLEDELRITARHDGHVHLRWDVSYRPWGDSAWTFATTTHHGAGEDVRRLADEFAQLFASVP